MAPRRRFRFLLFSPDCCWLPYVLDSNQNPFSHPSDHGLCLLPPSQLRSIYIFLFTLLRPHWGCDFRPQACVSAVWGTNSQGRLCCVLQPSAKVEAFRLAPSANFSFILPLRAEPFGVLFCVFPIRGVFSFLEAHRTMLGLPIRYLGLDKMGYLPKYRGMYVSL